MLIDISWWDVSYVCFIFYVAEYVPTPAVLVQRRTETSSTLAQALSLDLLNLNLSSLVCITKTMICIDGENMKIKLVKNFGQTDI